MTDKLDYIEFPSTDRAATSAFFNAAFGWGWDDFEWLTINAMKSSFWPFDKRLRIINEQIKPGYAALKASSLGSSLAGTR